ncbi:hypothetical protein [Alteribacillus sp. HJP-4]|uniref:hypothetical protein n=1 Tax=Alteribacillus sp. HJP-4 TaxID=2775394 RepID=UPI0035CD323A
MKYILIAAVAFIFITAFGSFFGTEDPKAGDIIAPVVGTVVSIGLLIGFLKAEKPANTKDNPN